MIFHNTKKIFLNISYYLSSRVVLIIIPLWLAGESNLQHSFTYCTCKRLFISSLNIYDEKREFKLYFLIEFLVIQPYLKLLKSLPVHVFVFLTYYISMDRVGHFNLFMQISSRKCSYSGLRFRGGVKWWPWLRLSVIWKLFYGTGRVAKNAT